MQLYIIEICCNTGKSALPDMYAQARGAQRPRASADISYNARVSVLQLICDTSGMAAVFIC